MTLTVENGCFSYKKQDALLLDHVSFSVGGGEIVSILGPNGAGKTTLLRCIMGFLKWQQGASLLDGVDVRGIPYRQFWRSVAYVPQARQSSAAYSVEETVMLGRSSHFGVFAQPGPQDVERVEQVMERLHIAQLRHKRCSEISGGELQMVLIARALASEPSVLILDEPESNLDFRNQLLVLDTISDLASQGMACVFNTHFPAHALQRAGKALLFCGGGKTLFGDTAAIVTEENIQTAFGVRAIIGQIETESSILQDVVPLELSRTPGRPDAPQDSRRLAVIAIITGNYDSGQRINALLHEYSGYLVGRMGMPYREGGVYIINVTIDAPEEVVRTLSHRLGILPDVSVKTTYAKTAFTGKEAFTFDES